jgi:5-methylcytosine-specific restriction endonuclease McrA
MLPQSRTLKGSVDAPGKVKPGTTETRSLDEQAGVQHNRGERSQEPSPAQAEQGGVTRVFVLSKDGTPLMPCQAARARELLAKGKAVVVRRIPFVIRLKHNPNEPAMQLIAIKLDPGSKTTGLAVVRVSPVAHHVLHLSEITHRGAAIRSSLIQRRAFRHIRRMRKTRYRPSRFNNRTRSKGWLPPSLQSRVDNLISWVARYRRWCPISEIAVETLRFDPQLLLNPEISGIGYQNGTLAGYELREYLLEKFNRCCAYCGAENVRLEIDHVQPRSRGGTNKASNLVMACHECNRTKGNQLIESFLGSDSEHLKRIKSQLQVSLRAAAAGNATRTKILHELFKTELPVEASTGGETKFNRSRFNVPKTHALDAACVGNTPSLIGWNIPALSIKAYGRGSYKRTSPDASGFPRGYLMRQKKAFGFQTGDIVIADVPKGKRTGKYFGRVSVRACGSFNIQTASGRVSPVGYKYCTIVQRADGYGY